MIEELVQLFIGVVDAQLLEGVDGKVFKSKNVQNTQKPVRERKYLAELKTSHAVPNTSRSVLHLLNPSSESSSCILISSFRLSITGIIPHFLFNTRLSLHMVHSILLFTYSKMVLSSPTFLFFFFCVIFSLV